MSRVKSPTLSPAITRRMCPACGYRGRELQSDRGSRSYECPSCAADLYARPAVSYAEMEGLLPPEARKARPEKSAPGAAFADPTLGRWGRRLEWAMIVLLAACIGGAIGAGAIVAIV